MKQRKPMRGLIWYLILVLVAATGVKALITLFRDGFDALMHREEGIAVIIVPLYLAAWFLVPKLKFLQPVSTAPAVPPEQNAPLKAPARLTIVRDSSVAGMAVANLILLDNEPACQIKDGERAVVTLTMKYSVLRVNATGSPNVRLDVEAPDGGVGEVHIKGGAFLPKTLKWSE